MPKDVKGLCHKKLSTPFLIDQKLYLGPLISFQKDFEVCYYFKIRVSG